MAEIDTSLIVNIRKASRILVRKFGLMNKTLAGTNYSPSAVHALLELDHNQMMTSKQLGEVLYLEKSSVSRMLAILIKNDEVKINRTNNDGREKIISLTTKGMTTVKAIHTFGNAQVLTAMKILKNEDVNTIFNGMNLYANALSPDHDIEIQNKIEIKEGYCDELIGSITSLHSRVYSEIAGFSAHFEALVGRNYSEFIMRLENDNNQTWYAMKNNEVIGGISIDGEDLEEGQAHLRWFVVDTNARSMGIGKILLQKALEFCDKNNFDEVHLWTFKGLDAAQNLYERNGFMLTGEELGSSYGKEAIERKFIRKSPIK